MMRPDGEAEEANRYARPRDKGVAKDRLAGEDRQDLRDDPERGQDQDVHLGMAERPEEMLPEQWITAVGRLEEMGAEMAVEEQEEASHRDARQREGEQERRDHLHPAEEWHPVDCQPRRTHAQDRHDEVD